MQFKLSIKNLSFIIINMFAFSQITIAAQQQQWSEEKNMTATLKDTINIQHVNPREQLIGKEGPSPSNQALVVFQVEQNAQILMCKDYDLRTGKDGALRPTHGTLKASFGFGLPKDHNFKNSFEAITKGPANTALYELFDSIEGHFLYIVPDFVYSEGGMEWGPAVTIPIILKAKEGAQTSMNEVKSVVNKLNEKANTKFASRGEGDIMTGRFRDFMLSPLTTLLHTGSDQSAVYDANKLEIVRLSDGSEVRLWDENQMRQNLLPHLMHFISKEAQ